MKRLALLQAAGAVFAFAALTILFFQSQTPHFEAHADIAKELPNVEKLDASLSAALIQERVGLLRNYDPIVAGQMRLRSSYTNLTRGVKSAYPDTPDDMARPLRDYGELLTRKDELIEDFKSGNAILRNSSQYLPTIAQITQRELRREGRSDNGRIDTLLRVALTYLNQPGEENRAPLTDAIEALEKWLPSSSSYAEQDARLLIAHARVVAAAKNRGERAAQSVCRNANLGTQRRFCGGVSIALQRDDAAGERGASGAVWRVRFAAGFCGGHIRETETQSE